VGMGRCQGRVCGSATEGIMAAVLNRDQAMIGRFRTQAPVKPVPMACVWEKPPEDIVL